MRLQKQEIRSWCSAQVYQRGTLVYSQHKVLNMDEKEERDSILLTALIRGSGSNKYRTQVSLRTEGDLLNIQDYECECLAYNTYSGLCKHCVAVCLAYYDKLNIRNNVKAGSTASQVNKKSSVELNRIFETYGAAEHNLYSLVSPGQLHILPVLEQNIYYYENASRMYAEIRVGSEHLYVIKSIPIFVASVLHGNEFTYGKKLKVYQSLDLFDAISQRVFVQIADAVRANYPTIDSRFDTYYFPSETRKIALSYAQSSALIELLNEATGSVTISGMEYKLVHGDPPIKLTMKASKSGGADMSISGLLRTLCPEPYGYFIFDGVIYHLSPGFMRNALPFLYASGAVNAKSKPNFFISEQDYPRFCATVLPSLKGFIEVDTGAIDLESYMPRTPEFSFYLSSGESGSVTVRSEVCYGMTDFPLEAQNNYYRNLKLEAPVVDLIHSLFPVSLSPTVRAVLDEDGIYALLDGGLDKLKDAGDVYIDDSLNHLRCTSRPAVSIGVALHGSLIDINVQAEGYSPDEINRIMDAYRLKKKYYRLKNGEFLSLTEGGLSVVAELSDGLNIRYNSNGMGQTDSFRAQYINSVIAGEDSQLSVRKNSDFKRQIRALADYRDSDIEIPQGLNTRLRSYQRTGFYWLAALAECGLGGILADDMGLGKTVQMLAYILHQGGSTLVVCPASLIFNWDSEAKRFAPGLETHLVRGSAAQREEALNASSGIFITSYDQLRRDIKLYEGKRFDCCVLDEAQYIRNAATKAAKSVKLINAEHRFALTGTPVENRLSDLWSIFDFLMPGYFYKYDEFRKSIELAAVNGDKAASAKLSRMCAPFILRRKKKDVLRELPDKVESILYVDMTDEQRELYMAHEQALRLSLLDSDDSQFIHQRLEFLAALTRLRQLCCTPELYLENYRGGSGKVEACMELLKESSESGHKTLVFSQFTGMLELLIARAQQEQLSWLYLSGKNTVEERRDMVNAFQNGSVSVFFISLKAGGTGLNLTAADRVIHFDPWWNFAAEDQASDRTHRIGQKSTVFVTKLVCKDTVEERILELQERKRSLSNMVMDDESVSTGSIDRNELIRLLSERA